MNQNIIVLEEIPQEFYKNKIGVGTSSQCFYLNNGDVYKEFFCPELYAETIKQLSKFSSKNILFPKKIIFLKDVSNKNFKGYLSDYATGVKLSIVEDDININIFLEHLELFEKELFYYVKNGIVAGDLHKDNLFYDIDKGFILFDISMFEISYEEDFNKKFKQILRDLSNTIVSEIIGDYSIYSNREEVKDIILKCMYYNILRPSMMIKNIKEIYENYGYMINTLGDFKNLFRMSPKL